MGVIFCLVGCLGLKGAASRTRSFCFCLVVILGSVVSFGLPITSLVFCLCSTILTRDGFVVGLEINLDSCSTE